LLLSKCGFLNFVPTKDRVELGDGGVVYGGWISVRCPMREDAQVPNDGLVHAVVWKWDAFNEIVEQVYGTTRTRVISAISVLAATGVRD